MKYIIINDQKYELIENYKDGYDQQELENKLTDYFENYDYVIGDWAYGKLRLKGFCKKDNPIYKEINDYSRKQDYIKKECASDCKYFVIEKIN